MRLMSLALCCFVLVALRGYALEPTEKLLFEKNSLYQYISVVEDTAKKELYIRNQKRELAQGGIYINSPEKLLFEFTQLGFVSLAFLDREPKDVLFVGLGAGAMPRYFNKHYPEAMIDIAEIDPDMVTVAQKYFFFRENEKMKVSVDDGRMFVKRTKKKYDLIVLDAYQNDYIPAHLTTLEFLMEVRSRLKEDGVVAANIVAPARNKFFDSMVMTYKKAFGRLYVFRGKRSSNFIFVALGGSKTKDRNDIVKRAEKIQSLKKFDIDLPEFAARFEDSKGYEWGGAKILTDDFNPVNLYKYQKNESR